VNTTTVEILCPSWCTATHETWELGMLEHEAEVYSATEPAPGYLPGAGTQTTSVYVYPGDPDPTINASVADQLTPEQARRLAAALLNAADIAESKEPERSTFVTIAWPDPTAIAAAWAEYGLQVLWIPGVEGDPKQAGLLLGAPGSPSLVPHLLVTEGTPYLDELQRKAEAALADPATPWACNDPGDSCTVHLHV
jgi:hypothetical protein